MKSCFKSTIRKSFSARNQLHTASKVAKAQICIVGAGPAGFYAAQHIIKRIPDAQVDIYERLPVPFGLVSSTQQRIFVSGRSEALRTELMHGYSAYTEAIQLTSAACYWLKSYIPPYGVAPDHPEVKNVIHTFTKTAEQRNVRFLGNIHLGRDVSLRDLQTAYHSVLLTYGADENRRLNIPGEDLENVLPARKIVGWYNGTPWDKDLKLDLSGETAAIIGQGNVAIDVARMLLTPIDELKYTDITHYALDQLAASKIKKVHLIGRRGPLQAAFTIKELREMLKLPGLNTTFTRDDFYGIDRILHSLPRPKKRISELMLNSIDVTKPGAGKEFVVKFLRSPKQFLTKAGTNKVGEVQLAVSVLRGRDYTDEVAISTSQSETLACSLAITSIGYKSVQADPDIPFEHERGVVRNTNSKVTDGFYSSGWLATGPTGVILTTMSNAFATAEVIAKDLSETREQTEAKPGYEMVGPLLKLKNVQIVEWEDWLKIDLYEQEEGKKAGKPREKIVDIAKMLQIVS